MGRFLCDLLPSKPTLAHVGACAIVGNRKYVEGGAVLVQGVLSESGAGSVGLWRTSSRASIKG